MKQKQKLNLKMKKQFAFIAVTMSAMFLFSCSKETVENPWAARSRRTPTRRKEGRTMRKHLAVAAAAVALAAPALAESTVWKFDPSHSHASFTVRHLVVSNVRG